MTASTAAVTIRRLGQPGDLGWVVQIHGELYAGEYGWDTSFEELVARIVADFAAAKDRQRQAAWIAELDGRRVGCVFCVAGDQGATDERVADTAQLRILIVTPEARGHRIGGRLVDSCLQFARDAGYSRITLWTNDVLTAARRIYQAAGFELMSEERHRSFGKDLIGQNWALDL